MTLRRALACSLTCSLAGALAGACDGHRPSPPPGYPPPPPGYPAPLPPRTSSGDGAATVPPAGAPAGAQSGSPGCGKAAKPGALAARHVTAAGRDRTYTLVVPERYDARKPYPLVFVLHGGGSSGARARGQTDLERVAGGRAVFVYPDAVRGNWDLDTPAPQNPDVALFDALSLVAFDTLCVDPRRVFVTGFSNGAYMANQLGCSRGDHIRAIATHAGGGPYDTHGGYDADGHLVCPGKAVAALVVHGLADTTVSPSEGDKSLAHWSWANRCSGSTQPAWVAPCELRRGCYQPVGVCKIPGLGHGLWKQAGRATWAFFDSMR